VTDYRHLVNIRLVAVIFESFPHINQLPLPQGQYSAQAQPGQSPFADAWTGADRNETCYQVKINHARSVPAQGASFQLRQGRPQFWRTPSFGDPIVHNMP